MNLIKRIILYEGICKKNKYNYVRTKTSLILVTSHPSFSVFDGARSLDSEFICSAIITVETCPSARLPQCSKFLASSHRRSAPSLCCHTSSKPIRNSHNWHQARASFHSALTKQNDPYFEPVLYMAELVTVELHMHSGTG